ncbi:unnamed protein product [Cuscuta campestris]|uniref:Uncharacterized protein n=1 Tax=Cuscuta campestris TaxID=132261 RepID=A0A484NIE4_9ASTE|nr:unnamed protein product [Cuscuta campestris]
MPMGPHVVARCRHVHHHGGDRRQHGHQAGEGELAPRLLRQTWTAQALERVREHAGGERLHEDEEVTLRRERRKPPPGHQRDRDDDRPARKNGGDCDELVLEGLRPMLAVGAGIIAAIIAGGNPPEPGK